MQRTIDNSPARRLAGSLLLPALLTFSVAATLTGQSFPSGSTGADGALNITAAGVTTFKAKPVGGGNVYNFTTINIATGSTLKLSGATFPLPLYFLATGAVTISGTIDLSGQSTVYPGTSGELSSDLLGPTTPGPGGYGGGSAAYAANPGLPGLGPAGGTVNGFYSSGGGFTGNQYLVPLVGGSGGGGGLGPGGAGGGALLIASSVSITVLGTITANGGATNVTGSGQPYPGPGAGGAIRLVAPTIAGNGTITVSTGGSAFASGNNGVIRMEAFTYSFTGTTTGTLYLATPYNLFLPTSTGQPSIMVTSIGGVAVPASPTGSFTMPDVTLNSSSPLTINIQATNIPAGTTATVYFSTESNTNQAIVSTPLAATATAGVTTATASVTLKSGFSKGFVVATWTH